MKKARILHKDDRLEIFIYGIKSKKNASIGVVGRNLVVWGKKVNIIKLPYKAEITGKVYENNGLKIILKRQWHGNKN